MLSFLDDFLNLASRLQISVNTNKTLSILGNLGFQVNWEKSCLIPSQRIVYLGVNLNLDDLTLSLPMDKVQQLLVYAHKVQEAEFLSRRDLERLVGFLNFAADFLPLGRLYLKPIIHWLNQNTSAFIRDQPTLVDQALREALLPWLDIVALTSPIPMHLPEATIEIMTDASRYGWSGVLLPHQVHGIWEEEEKLQSMNWMELKTILLVLLEFADYCQGQCIRLFTDNMTALACLNRQGSSHFVSLWSLIKEILELCQEKEIVLLPVHIAGPLNVLADKGSRSSPISTEWSLDRPSFLWACRELGLVPEVDLFATRENAQLPSFVSPCLDPWADAQDSFTVDWNRWSIIYLFPPIPCLARVAVRLLSFRGAGILIAPIGRIRFGTLLFRGVGRCFHSL